MGMHSNGEFMEMLAQQPRRRTREEAAAILGVSVRTLENWHRQGLPPKALKHGVRGVRYLDSDLLALRNQWNESGN